jgi:hypothetical protein
MRRALTATVAAAAALIVVGVLGVAVAEGPSSSPPRTVSVQGVATETIDRSASASAATAVYRRGMSDAISDGVSKAQFLASKAGANLGAVQSIVEDGGYITCVGETEYIGEQPDFGSPGGSLPTAYARGSVPLARKAPSRRAHHKTPAAKKANVSTCTLATQVSLAYVLN